MNSSSPLREYVPRRIWLREHPVRYAGTSFLSRMTVLRLRGGDLLLHSPVEIDAQTREAIEAIGPVRHIVAPSTFHHLWVETCQAAFPEAATYAIPGLRRTRPDLHFDVLLGDEPEAPWRGELEQVVFDANPIMKEVVFYDRESRTLILVDLVENFRTETPGLSRSTKLWMMLFLMWNRPRPAPELQLLTFRWLSARRTLRHIIGWDADRAIIAHGELLESDVRGSLRRAWWPLSIGLK